MGIINRWRRHCAGNSIETMRFHGSGIRVLEVATTYKLELEEVDAICRRLVGLGMLQVDPGDCDYIPLGLTMNAYYFHKYGDNYDTTD